MSPMEENAKARDPEEQAVITRQRWAFTTWCAISGRPCWPGRAGLGYRSAARSETRQAMAV